MRYRIRYFPDGYEYHAYNSKPPVHTEGWEDVAELPKEIKDAEKAAMEAPTKVQSLENEVAALRAEIETLKERL